MECYVIKLGRYREYTFDTLEKAKEFLENNHIITPIYKRTNGEDILTHL